MKNYRTFLKLIGLYAGGLAIALIIFLTVINLFVNPPIGKDIDRYILAKYEFRTRDNESVNLSEKFKGDTYLVDFWTVGCSFCLDDLKKFYELDLSQKSDFYIIAINKDDFNRWNEFLKKQGFESTSQILHLNLKDKSILEELDVEYFPTYFLVDETGRIKSRCSYGFVLAKLKRYLGEDTYYKDFIESLYSILPCEGLGKPVLVYTFVVYPVLLGVYYLIKKRKALAVNQ